MKLMDFLGFSWVLSMKLIDFSGFSEVFSMKLMDFLGFLKEIDGFSRVFLWFSY